MSEAWRATHRRQKERRPDPPKPPKVSWWLDATPDGFTDLARQWVKTPEPFVLQNDPKRYD